MQRIISNINQNLIDCIALTIKAEFILRIGYLYFNMTMIHYYYMLSISVSKYFSETKICIVIDVFLPAVATGKTV